MGVVTTQQNRFERCFGNQPGRVTREQCRDMAINEIVSGKTRELRQSIIDKKDVSIWINRQHTLVHTLHEYAIRLVGTCERDDLGIRPFHHHEGVNISMMDRMNYLLSVVECYGLNIAL